MKLDNILSISGKPGLFKLVSNVGKAVIVESLLDGKRLPISAAHKVSTLEDISIYTYDADIPLGEVFDKIYEKESGGKAIDHKSSGEALKDYMGGVMPKFDEDRVYTSDLKKLFQWYNLLHDHKLLIEGDTESDTDTVEDAEIIEESGEADSSES